MSGWGETYTVSAAEAAESGYYYDKIQHFDWGGGKNNNPVYTAIVRNRENKQWYVTRNDTELNDDSQDIGPFGTPKQARAAATVLMGAQGYGT